MSHSSSLSLFLSNLLPLIGQMRSLLLIAACVSVALQTQLQNSKLTWSERDLVPINQSRHALARSIPFSDFVWLVLIVLSRISPCLSRACSRVFSLSLIISFSLSISRPSACLFPLSEIRIRCRYASCDVRTRVYVWWVACHDMTHCIIHSHAPFARWSDGLTYWLNFDSQRLETWWERHFIGMSPNETRYLILQTMSPDIESSFFERYFAKCYHYNKSVMCHKLWQNQYHTIAIISWKNLKNIYQRVNIYI